MSAMPSAAVAPPDPHAVIMAVEPLRARADADLARRSRISVLSYFILWLVLVAATDLAHQSLLEVWVPGALFLLIGVFRLILVSRFDSIYPRYPVRWQWLYAAGALGSALVWGLFCARIIQQTGIGELALMVLLATAGIAAGGMAALAPVRVVMTTFLALLLLPSVVATLLVASPTGTALPWLTLAFFGFLLLTGRRLHDEYWQGLRTAHELAANAEQLATLGHRNEMILNAVGDGIFGVDAAGRIRFFNPAGAKLLGMTPSALLGCDAHDSFQHSRINGIPHPREHSALQQSLHDGSTRRAADEVYWRPDGTCFPVELLVSPLTEAGRAVGAVVVFRDNTARQQLEQEMRKAMELAEEANRGKTQFLAAMGHELRTPLNGVLGITGLMDNTELNALQRELLAALKSSAETLLASMNSILEYTSLESCATRLQCTNFHLPGAVRATLERYYRAAEKKGIVLEEEIDSGVPPLLCGDATLLQQLLAKLIDNAIKFSGRGVVRVRVMPVSGLAAGACRLRLEVIDHGPGVPAMKRDRIFDAFTQADSSTTRAHGGLGLGLAIARRLALLQGGTIDCDNATEGGCVFRVELPCRVAT